MHIFLKEVWQITKSRPSPKWRIVKGFMRIQFLKIEHQCYKWEPCHPHLLTHSDDRKSCILQRRCHLETIQEHQKWLFQVIKRQIKITIKTTDYDDSRNRRIEIAHWAKIRKDALYYYRLRGVFNLPQTKMGQEHILLSSAPSDQTKRSHYGAEPRRRQC